MNAPIHTPNLFPIDAFPIIAREAAQEVEHNVQAPLSLIATAMLAAMSATAQESVKVKLPTSADSKPVSLYTLIVAESGERKTTVDLLFFKPLYKRDQVHEARYTAEMEDYKLKLSVFDSIKRELTRQITHATCAGNPTDDLTARLMDHQKLKPKKPQPRRHIFQNASQRSILDAMEGDGRSIALLGDEGEFILRSPLFSQNGVLNKAWDGGPVILDRGNGVSLTARDTRTTVSIMVQGEVLRDFLQKRGQSARGSGFLARILMTCPQSTQGWRINDGGDQSWDALHALHDVIDELLGDATCTPCREAVVYEFDDDAIHDWISYTNNIEANIRPTGALRNIPDFASKAGEITARIAALLHHFGRQQGKMSRDTLKRAMDLMDFYLNEFLRLFSPQFEVPHVHSDAMALEQYLHRVCWAHGVTLIGRNDVYRCCHMRDKSRFASAVQLLCHQDKIKIELGQNKRHLIILNPAYFANRPILT